MKRETKYTIGEQSEIKGQMGNYENDEEAVKINVKAGE
jgi:hypothetical protein